MVKNYLTIILRTFRRNFIYSSVNIIGLALGLAGSFVMGAWVLQELSYDKHFKNHENIYRVSVEFFSSGAFALGPEILKPTLLEVAPEVDMVGQLGNGSLATFKVGQNTFEEDLFTADKDFFKVIEYDFIVGNASKVMDNPNSIVISTDIANKWFGKTDILGETVFYNDMDFVITGVVSISDNPSHIPAKIWLPMKDQGRTNWTGAARFIYVKLKENATRQSLEQRLSLMREEIVYPTVSRAVEYEEWTKMNIFNFFVVPLADIHLDPDMRFEMQPGGNKANVYVFMVISIFLVLIATINFINLSTAQSVKRAREVGIRKVLGTNRGNLILQYLSESVVMSLIAAGLAIGLAELFLILFEYFTSEKLLNGLFVSPVQIIVFVVFSLLVGVLAGLYPAIYLSHFQPATVLRKSQMGEGKTLRQTLVVVQFTISIVLISCSLIVYEQLEHLNKVDIGLDRENVLFISNANTLGNHKENFRDKLLSHNGVISASYNKRMPAGRALWVNTLKSDEAPQGKGYQSFYADDQYIPLLGMEILEGRNFSRKMASDSTAIILNESAARELLLDEPIGSELKSGDMTYTVVGIVRDFGYRSFYEKPGPVAMLYDPDGFRLAIKIRGSQAAEVVDYMHEEWNSLSLDEPVNYGFLDDSFEALLEKEKTLAHTIGFFTSIAIIVSCLGLFGLAAFMANAKKKEIGIRKVLGSTVAEAVLLLNKSFSKLIVVALVVSIPLSYLLMDNWLRNFEFKISVNLMVFLLAGAMALIVAWLTVGYMSFRAASANPVESLRDE